jgi:small subunit ribosomal protein S4
VNGKRINIPSYPTKIGDVVSLAEGLKGNVGVQRSVSNQLHRQIPTWLELSPAVSDALGRSKDLPIDLKDTKIEGTVRLMPTREEMSFPVNEQYIVELYSK